MGRKRKFRPTEAYDAFYCTIDRWHREYHFHIKYPESRKDLTGRSFYEWDRVEIGGRVRHHSRSRTTYRRPFEIVEVWLFPVHLPRSEWRKDPSDLGGLMQASNGLLRVSIDLAADPYYSIIHSLSANHFKQIKVHIRNMRFSRRNVDGIEFDPEETPSDELN